MAGEIVLRCALAKAFMYRPGRANAILEKYGSADEVMKNRNEADLAVCGEILDNAFAPDMLEWAEKEVEWCGNKGVEIICYGEKRYPQLLKEIPDAPNMLFYRGTADLNCPRSISMVGTRLASAYGREMCARIMGDVGKYSPLVISGLAYGIDIACHKAALEAGLETVAVLPNGLDSIYPARHRETAARMVQQGGILTEFPRGEFPQRMNFIKRNRIIAALAQGLVVVESRVKGGSMITAEYASGYGRDIFAVPGRLSDSNSFGCNYLIAKNVAAIYNSPSTLPAALGWAEDFVPDSSFQPQLFSYEVDDKEKILLSLKFDSPVSVEQICAAARLGWEKASLLLLELELEGRIKVKNNTEYYLNK